MGVCSCTVKFLLFVFNLLCALVGLAILVSAVYFYLQTNSLKDLGAGYISTTFVIMMVIGGVTFIVAFIGCCGACNEDPCCISTYATLLSIILICQLVLAGVMLYVAQADSIELEIRGKLEKEYHNYETNPKGIDLLQTTFRCCGYDGPSTFKLIRLPPSCCPKKTDNSNDSPGDAIFHAVAGDCNFSNAFKDGCGNRVINLMKGGGKDGSITLFVIGAVELLCIISAFCIANSIRRDHTRY